MRRKDREVTDPARIREIIAGCQCCRLGFSDEGKVYIVPLNFGYEERNGGYIFYFHGAKEGRKIDLIARNGYAGFEMDTHYQMIPAQQACSHSARFQSMIGGGTVSFVEEPEEKRAALQVIMRHNTGRDDWGFPESAVNGVCVFKLEVEELSCKEHL